MVIKEEITLFIPKSSCRSENVFYYSLNVESSLIDQ